MGDSGKFTKESRKKLPGRGKSERTKILEAMERQGRTEEDFYELMTNKAFDPKDSFGFGELIKRFSPTTKQVAPLVNFEFDKDAPPHVQATQVMNAASSGKIAPDIARMFVDSIAAVIKIQEITDIDERLKAMENKIEQP